MQTLFAMGERGTSEDFAISTGNFGDDSRMRCTIVKKGVESCLLCVGPRIWGQQGQLQLQVVGVPQLQTVQGLHLRMGRPGACDSCLESLYDLSRDGLFHVLETWAKRCDTSTSNMADDMEQWQNMTYLHPKQLRRSRSRELLCWTLLARALSLFEPASLIRSAHRVLFVREMSSQRVTFLCSHSISFCLLYMKVLYIQYLVQYSA